MNTLLSVIILSYNTKEFLKNCLNSVVSSDGFRKDELEIIVVDNASVDGSAEMVSKKFTRVNLIKNCKNIGFSAGNNAGIREAKGKYILLLNSDTKVQPNVLCSMIRIIEQDENIGAATCKLVLENGKLDPASHRGFPTPWNSFFYLMFPMEKLFPRSKLFAGYHQGWKDYSIPHEVDAISGAFFMIPRKVIERVGLLDESFFMYGEDIDWCYRIKQAGYKIIFNPKATTVHYKKQSGRGKLQATSDNPSADGQAAENIRKRTQERFINTMGQFYMKHYADKYPTPVTWLVKTGIFIRKYL